MLLVNALTQNQHGDGPLEGGATSWDFHGIIFHQAMTQARGRRWADRPGGACASDCNPRAYMFDVGHPGVKSDEANVDSMTDISVA